MSEYDVHIIGAGVVGAGDYRKVNISGTGTITGKVTAESLSVNGVAKANDLITADKIEINGTITGKQMKGHKMIIRGLSDFEGNLECDQFELNGSIKCPSINAEQMDINLKGFGEVNELVGSKISVKVNIPNLIILNVHIKPSVMKARLIEADEIFLENTEADVVCGNVIQIGKGCKIGRLEYSESLKISESSSVDQIVKD